MSPDARFELQATLGDAYTLERELGGGGMSRVWLATETALGRQVVVKVISPELREGLSAERFTREVRLAARLQQANIVPLLSAGTSAGAPWYTMPFVSGESLRARLASGTPPSLTERISILRDVARALAYAHGEGVVHRDIKPENVLLSHGTAVVTDFGIAKALTAARTLEGAAHATLTQAGGTIGTPAYMAPEQAVGDAVDHRTDLYAWGVVAYELLSGAHPFVRHTTPQTLITAHLTESPAALTPAHGVPPALAALVLRCLEKDPARRPASAAELLTALDAVTTPSGTGETAPSAVAPRRRRVGALIVVGVLIVALAVWMLQPRGGSNEAGGTTPDQSLAVLPLANLSGNQTDDFFGIGLAEEITRALAKNGVRVIGRVSAGALQAKGLDERAIARELGVGSLLTGTVQRSESQIRINVTLVSASDGAVRWTERYVRPLTNVFAVQDEIARTVAATLLGSLGRRPAAAERVETSDPEAHALHLQGMVLFNRRGPRPLQQAIALFERAAARDPAYARPRAALAMALAVLPAYVPDSIEATLRRAIAAAERAITIDSSISESYTALGYSHLLLGDLWQSDSNFRRALSIDTTATALGWASQLAARLGDFSTANALVTRARELEPASVIAHVWVAQVLEQEGRLEAADSVASQAVGLDSTFGLAWSWRARAQLGLGRSEAAIALLQRRVALLPDDSSQEPHSMLAYAYALAGRFAEARAELDARSGRRVRAIAFRALALDELGDHEGAVKMFADAIARREPWLVLFPHSRVFGKLGRDPRVAAMLDQLKRKP